MKKQYLLLKTSERLANDEYCVKLWNEWFVVSGELENSLCYNIPERHYDKIDKAFIAKVSNLESLRVLRGKIGYQRYLDLLGAKCINEETDHQGNKMRLFSCSEVGEKALLLEVVCPSTDRVFHMYPVNQKAQTCFEAKGSTFNNKLIAYRHGDVALFKVDGEKITVPFSET